MAALVGMRKSPKYGLPDQTASMSFTSRALPAFFKKIGNHSEAQILDLGPVCSENINLFARRIKRLYLFDIFSKLAREKKKTSGSDRWRLLDYSPAIFDGIILWDLPDRLGDDDARKIGSRCDVMLKPGGMVVVWAAPEAQTNTKVNTFVINQGFKVIHRLQPHLNLPLHTRKNRDLLDVLRPLKSVQAFIFRNGLREFVMKKA